MCHVTATNAPASTTTLHRILHAELTCADLDGLDDETLRQLHNLLDHWCQLAELRLDRRRQQQSSE